MADVARRFGRNQKRRMREALAMAQADAERRREHAVLATQEKHKAEALLFRIKQSLPGLCVALPAVTRQAAQMDYKAWHRHCVMVRDRLDRLMPAKRGDVSYDDDILALPVMVARAMSKEDLFDIARRKVHCVLEFDGRVVGYCIDADTLRGLGPEAAAAVMAPEMARLLAQELCGHD